MNSISDYFVLLVLLPTTVLSFHQILTITSSCNLGETEISGDESEYTLEWNGQYPFNGQTSCWTKFAPNFGIEVCGNITGFDLNRNDLKLKKYDGDDLVQTYYWYNGGVGNYYCTTSEFAIVIEGENAIADSDTSSSYVHLQIYGQDTGAVKERRGSVTIIVAVVIVLGVIGIIATIVTICIYKKIRADRAKRSNSKTTPSTLKHGHVITSSQNRNFIPAPNQGTNRHAMLVGNRNKVDPSLPENTMPPPTGSEEQKEDYFKNSDALYNGGQTTMDEPPRPIMASQEPSGNNPQYNYSTMGNYGFGQTNGAPVPSQQKMSYAVIGPSHTRMNQ